LRYIGFDREEEAEKWARDKLNLPAAPEFFRAAAAVDATGEFVCVVVMTNFTPRNVDLNIAIDKQKVRPKATIEMFNGIFGFLFDKLGAARVTGLLRGKNVESRRITEHFGFKLEGVMRAAFPDDDLHVYGFLAEEYRTHAWRKG
jgi:RimJ/RimL family protein N-acetyltransferase